MLYYNVIPRLSDINTEVVEMELYDIARDISVSIVSRCAIKEEDVKKVFGIVLKEVIKSSEDTLPTARAITTDITVAYIESGDHDMTVAQASKLFGKVLKEVYNTFPEGKILDEYLGRGKSSR
jgi:hypothetical protein